MSIEKDNFLKQLEKAGIKIADVVKSCQESNHDQADTDSEPDLNDACQDLDH